MGARVRVRVRVWVRCRRYMEEARIGEQDPSQWDANYERRKSIPEPSDWNYGDRGLNDNPFAGVRMPGWFMSEHTHEQSSDPLIMKQNQRLWDACDAGDADEALRSHPLLLFTPLRRLVAPASRQLVVLTM